MKYRVGFFSQGYARLAKVILKGTLASESHSFNKTNIHNAVGEHWHVIASSGAFTTLAYYSLFYEYICASVCLHAQSNLHSVYF